MGVGEVSRHIISKTILSTIREDTREAVGSLQMCVGQRSGCKTVIHALNEIYEKDSTEGLLLRGCVQCFQQA